MEVVRPGLKEEETSAKYKEEFCWAGFDVRQMMTRIWASPATSCVTLGESRPFAEPQKVGMITITPCYMDCGRDEVK